MVRKPITFLVVDDDPAMVTLIERIVSRDKELNFVVEVFGDPIAAKNRMQEIVVDILLTDLEMPHLDGVHLLKFAKSRNALTQVLLLTGHSSQDALMAALEIGAADYLLKPLDSKQLIEVLHEAQRRNWRWTDALRRTWQNRHASAC